MDDELLKWRNDIFQAKSVEELTDEQKQIYDPLGLIYNLISTNFGESKKKLLAFDARLHPVGSEEWKSACQLEFETVTLQNAEDLIMSLMYGFEHPIFKFVSSTNKTLRGRRKVSLREARIRGLISAFLEIYPKVKNVKKKVAHELIAEALLELGIPKRSARAIESYEVNDSFGVLGYEFVSDLKNVFRRTEPEKLFPTFVVFLARDWDAKAIWRASVYLEKYRTRGNVVR